MIWHTELRAMETVVAGAARANSGEANPTHCGRIDESRCQRRRPPNSGLRAAAVRGNVPPCVNVVLVRQEGRNLQPQNASAPAEWKLDITSGASCRPFPTIPHPHGIVVPVG